MYCHVEFSLKLFDKNCKKRGLSENYPPEKTIDNPIQVVKIIGTQTE